MIWPVNWPRFAIGKFFGHRLANQCEELAHAFLQLGGFHRECRIELNFEVYRRSARTVAFIGNFLTGADVEAQGHEIGSFQVNSGEASMSKRSPREWINDCTGSMAGTRLERAERSHA